MPTIDLRSLLETRIKEAEADIEKLRAALNAIDEPHSAPAPRPSRAVTKTAAKPQLKAIPLEKLLKVITEQPAITTTTLAKETGGHQSAILALLKEQEGSQVRREGERRGTRWFVITDEDRVAARAKKIEARQFTGKSAQATSKATAKRNGSAPKATMKTNQPKAMAKSSTATAKTKASKASS
jgi:hypothetical protein